MTDPKKTAAIQPESKSTDSPKTVATKTSEKKSPDLKNDTHADKKDNKPVTVGDASKSSDKKKQDEKKKEAKSPVETVEDAKKGNKAAIELQQEALSKAPKNIEEVKEKATENAVGSPAEDAKAKIEATSDKTPREVYDTLKAGKKPKQDDEPKQLTPKQEYVSLADVAIPTPTNLAEACLAGVKRPAKIEEFTVAGNLSSINSVVSVPGQTPDNSELPATIPGSVPGSAVASMLSTNDITMQKTGNHLNPVAGAPSQSSIETPGLLPMGVGTLRLNPVKVPGSPYSVVTVPLDGASRKTNTSYAPALNIPGGGAGAVAPLVVPNLPAVNIPPVPSFDCHQVFVNQPESVVVPPASVSKARSAAAPHMNPVKLAGAPLAIRTPVGEFAHNVFVKLADEGVDTTDLIEHFVNGDSNDSLPKKKKDRKKPTHSNDKKHGQNNKESSGHGCIASEDGPVSDAGASKSVGDSQHVITADESPKEVYQDLADVQKVQQTSPDVDVEPAKEVYEELTHAPPAFYANSLPATFANSAQIRDVHLNPVKVPGGIPGVIQTQQQAVAAPGLDASYVKMPTVNAQNVPGGAFNTVATPGENHLNPVGAAPPSVIQTTPPALFERGIGATSVTNATNALNVLGTCVTVPLNNVPTGLPAQNVPPMANSGQKSRVNVNNANSQNVPGGTVNVQPNSVGTVPQVGAKKARQ